MPYKWLILGNDYIDVNVKTTPKPRTLAGPGLGSLCLLPTGLVVRRVAILAISGIGHVGVGLPVVGLVAAIAPGDMSVAIADRSCLILRACDGVADDQSTNDAQRCSSSSIAVAVVWLVWLMRLDLAWLELAGTPRLDNAWLAHAWLETARAETTASTGWLK